MVEVAAARKAKHEGTGCPPNSLTFGFIRLRVVGANAIALLWDLFIGKPGDVSNHVVVGEHPGTWSPYRTKLEQRLVDHLF